MGTGFTDPVPSWFGKGYYTINSSLHTPKDANGNNSVDWFAKYVASGYYKSNPDIGGSFMDNVLPRPRVAGGWHDNGAVLQPSDPKASMDVTAGTD